MAAGTVSAVDLSGSVNVSRVAMKMSRSLLTAISETVTLVFGKSNFQSRQAPASNVAGASSCCCQLSAPLLLSVGPLIVIVFTLTCRLPTLVMRTQSGLSCAGQGLQRSPTVVLPVGATRSGRLWISRSATAGLSLSDCGRLTSSSNNRYDCSMNPGTNWRSVTRKTWLDWAGISMIAGATSTASVGLY